MPTLADVARHAGVSVSIASRVLNNDPALRARSETRATVRRAAATLEYEPNHAGRSLRLSQADTIAIVIPDIINPIFTDMLRGVEEESSASQLQVLLGRSESLLPGNDYLRRLVGGGRVDGFIVQLPDHLNVRDFESFVGQRLPLVLMHSKGSRPGSVVADDVLGARIATEHLLGLGHSDIAFVGGVVQNQTSQRRAQGFADALREAGVRRRRSRVLSSGYFPADGRNAGAQLFADGGQPPTAVVVANFNAALGVQYSAAERGLEIPRHVSLVAIHDTWLADYVTPALTTVRMPLYEVGRTSVRLLTARMAGGPGQDVVVTDPPPELVLRASTGPPYR